MTDEFKVPDGYREVSEGEFFAAMKADPRDIMPSNRWPLFTLWEDRVRNVWGWSVPGWKNSYTAGKLNPKKYAIKE